MQLIADIALKGQELSAGSIVLLVVAVGLAFAFEFVNGFHDTANAVATVIYTRSLPPWIAVIWSGLWNLLGVLFSPLGVAFGVIALLPNDLVMNAGSGAALAMVFALLLSAMAWNLGTWYLGLPASSSHSLFGAIMGVGIASSIMAGHTVAAGVNWQQLTKTLLSLLISPVVGFVGAGLLLLMGKAIIRWPQLFAEPDPSKKPPLLIRSLMILTCTGVSFGHGSNDGQKGMGLVLLILIGILPGTYALNPKLAATDVQQIRATAVQVQQHLPPAAGMVGEQATATVENYLKNDGKITPQTLPAVAGVNQRIIDILGQTKSLAELNLSQRSGLREMLYMNSAALAKLASAKAFTDPKLIALLGSKTSPGYLSQLDSVTKFIPPWVKIATALSLGLGTMIGWKRIVVTVGEKIGKTHLNYAQGASSELVAAATIFLADRFGLPVSTTHVLSSGVAGTMAANHSGLQARTLRNLLLAWVLTLPVCVLMGAALFSATLVVILNNLLLPVGIAAAIALIGVAVFLNVRRIRRKTDQVIQDTSTRFRGRELTTV